MRGVRIDRRSTAPSRGAELATLLLAVIVGASAALPTAVADRQGLLVVAALLVAFTLMWFHVIPRRWFGAERQVVGAAIVQVIAAVLVAETGGASVTRYFLYYSLPVLATVFHVRPRNTLIVGALAVGLFFVIAATGETSATEETRDAALIRLVALLAVVVTSLLLARALGAVARRQILESSRLRALVDAVHDPIFVTDADGRISISNPAAQELFGVVATGSRLAEILPFVGVRPAIDTTPRWTGRMADATGRTVEIEVVRTDVEGDEERHVYLVHDVSRYAEVNQLREQLLYSVAHELRGPLTVLDTSLDLLRSEFGALSANEAHDLLATTQRASQRMRTLMDDLLSAGNVQSGRFVVASRDIALNVVIREAIELVTPDLTQCRQSIVTDEPSGGSRAFADPRYVRQVLVNLLSNASKYGSDRDEIRIRLTEQGEWVRCAIEDHGVGIPSDQQAGLFERYYRVRHGAADTGIGLGLAIAKGIVAAHGGQIGVDSEIGRGTTVWFTLPKSTT